MSEEIVSWATPLTRAQKAVSVAEDLFEKRDFEAGLERLHYARAQYELAAAFVLNIEIPKKDQQEARRDR